MITASLAKDPEFHDHKPALKILLDTPASKEIRISMRKGQVMKEHKAPYPIVVHIVQGVITFAAGNEMHQLQTGDIIALEALVLHELTALEDTIVRLSLHKSTHE